MENGFHHLKTGMHSERTRKDTQREDEKVHTMYSVIEKFSEFHSSFDMKETKQNHFLNDLNFSLNYASKNISNILPPFSRSHT